MSAVGAAFSRPSPTPRLESACQLGTSGHRGTSLNATFTDRTSSPSRRLLRYRRTRESQARSYRQRHSCTSRPAERVALRYWRRTVRTYSCRAATASHRPGHFARHPGSKSWRATRLADGIVPPRTTRPPTVDSSIIPRIAVLPTPTLQTRFRSEPMNSFAPGTQGPAPGFRSRSQASQLTRKISSRPMWKIFQTSSISKPSALPA